MREKDSLNSSSERPEPTGEDGNVFFIDDRFLHMNGLPDQDEDAISDAMADFEAYSEQVTGDSPADDEEPESESVSVSGDDAQNSASAKSARIPDPDKNEISHEDFLAAGHSFAALEAQRQADADLAKQERAAQTWQSLQEAGPAAAAVGMLFGGAATVIERMASAGKGLIADSVAAYTFNKAKKQLDSASYEAGERLGAIREGIRSALSSGAPGQSESEVTEQFLNSAEGQSLAASAGDALDRAFKSASMLASKGAQLELDLDMVSERSLGVLQRLKQDSEDLLEKVRINGQTLSERFEQGLQDCMKALTEMAGKIAALFGLGRNQAHDVSAQQPTGPRAG